MAAGDVTISDTNKKAYIARLEATALEGGGFSSPHQKIMELIDLLRALINAVTIT